MLSKIKNYAVSESNFNNTLVYIFKNFVIKYNNKNWA